MKIKMSKSQWQAMGKQAGWAANVEDSISNVARPIGGAIEGAMQGAKSGGGAMQGAKSGWQSGKIDALVQKLQTLNIYDFTDILKQLEQARPDLAPRVNEIFSGIESAMTAAKSLSQAVKSPQSQPVAQQPVTQPVPTT